MKRNVFIRIGLVVLIAISITTLPAPAIAKKGGNGHVSIYRDIYGVPHIYAKDNFSLFYGYGYALATDRLFQMEMSKRTVIGTVAEVLGKDYIEFDKSVRSNYTPVSIQQQYEALPKSHKDIFDGYAAGMNARIDEVIGNNQLLPREYIDFGFVPCHWSPVDVIMIFVGTMANRFSDFNTEIDNLSLLEYLKGTKGSQIGVDMFNQLKWQNDPAAPTTVPSKKLVAASKLASHSPTPTVSANDKSALNIVSKMNQWRKQEYILLSKLGLGGLSEQAYKSRVFSNCWIAGKQKAVGGGAIFMNGPQFGDFVPGYVYEVGLHGAGFDAVGTAPFGYPFVQFGHNKHAVWGSTAGLGDLVDMYEEELNPTNIFQYKFNNQWLEMEKRTDTILVKDEPPVTLDIYRTVHGFVVLFDIENSRAFAKKRTWEGYEVQSLIAWIDSTKVENYQQWIKQAEKYALSINWYYADRRGNIGYAHTGLYPIRKTEHDGRLPAPGTGEMEWIGMQPFSKNPQVYNPAQGFIANWNNKPADYWDGPDLWFWNWGSADRVQVIIDAMNEKEKFTPEEIWNMNERFSFFDQNVGYFLPFLKQAVEAAPSSREAEAVAMLDSWDAGRVDKDKDGKYDNPAQVIMDKWVEIALKNTFEDDVGPFYLWYAGGVFAGPGEITNGAKILYHCLLADESSIENKYDFFNGVPANEVVLASLSQALVQLEAEYGTSNISEWKAPLIPHVFSNLNFAGIPQTSAWQVLSLPMWMNRGTQNNMVVLKPRGVYGVNVCPPGQSGFVAPNNEEDEHYSDQMDLYENFESKPMLFEFKDIRANMESVIHLKID